MNIKWVGSVNKTVGRRGYRPEAVVVHIMEGTLVGTDAWFNNPDSKVSAHYGIGRKSEIHEYVMEQDSAWHAGRKSANAPWELLKPNVNPNYYTIGIEHEGHEHDLWGDPMYRASASLIHQICLRWNIPIDRKHIIGHREIYTMKSCPGDGADLDKLVELAVTEVFSPSKYNFVPQQGEVGVRLKLNIRKQFPTTKAERVRQVPAGTRLQYVGWSSNGQAVNGNSHWYKDPDGNTFGPEAQRRHYQESDDSNVYVSP